VSHPRSHHPGAFFASLFIHCTRGRADYFFTYYASHHQSEAPVIFELVAGPPTAPDELVAAALGNTKNPVKLDVPRRGGARIGEGNGQAVETRPPRKRSRRPKPAPNQRRPRPAPKSVEKSMTQEMSKASERRIRIT